MTQCPVAQLVERAAVNRQGAGSSPARAAKPAQRPAVLSYDPADWPYPHEEDAEREWAEACERLAVLPGKTPNVVCAGDDDL